MLYDLSLKRSLIKISGQDKNTFLQRIITQDINLLESQDIIYSLILTPQGKFLYDLFIIKYQDYFFLDVLLAEKENIINHLNKYKLRADILIEDIVNEYKLFFASTEIKSDYIIAMKDPRKKDYGYRIIIKNTQADDFNKSNKLSLEDEYNIYRIQNVIVETPIDMIKDKNFPLECNMEEMNAISFTKGCYVGQEVTTRTKHRGVVRKKIFYIKTDHNINEDDIDISLDQVKIGERKSFYKNEALALIKFSDIDLANGKLNLNGKNILTIF